MKSSNKSTKYQSGNLILKSTQQLGPLILGDCNSAMDKKIHKQFNIQTIISIGQQAMPMKEKLPENCKHFFYDVHDNKSQKVPIQLFDEINKLIQSGRKIGGVLVHCYAGVSRSSTFVIAYIMQKFLKSYDDAKQEVKNARSCIYPNDGFVHHLKSYQKVIQKREYQRLKKIQDQKRLQMENSLVRSARKSVRGGVRSADVSPERVKQMAQQAKKHTHELIIQPVQMIKQENQEVKSPQIVKIKNNSNDLAKSINKNKQQQRVNSRSVFSNKQKINDEKKNKQIKLPQLNEKLNSQTKKLNKNQGSNLNKDKKQISSSHKTQRSLVSRSNFQKVQENPAEKIQKSVIIKKQQQKASMKQSKSVISTKKQKSTVSSINENLLNENEKKIKKIYQTKIFVK